MDGFTIFEITNLLYFASTNASDHRDVNAQISDASGLSSDQADRQREINQRLHEQRNARPKPSTA